MNISVRVLSAQAQAQIKALQAQVAGLETQLASANKTSGAAGMIGGSVARRNLLAYGSQLQWTGRQIQYNWTLPILLAAGAATKFALDNEKAMTRVKKLYGDNTAAAAQFNKQVGLAADAQYGQSKASRVFSNELDALGDAFEAMSNRYGINRTEVLDTAAAWAEAGSSGVALAKSTQLSIKASILGDLSLADATKSLIAIQSQYSLSTSQLNLTLSQLNAIENQTGADMADLIEAFSKTAGVAREFGVDTRHLGAMIAALVPATGSAATAGNGLKTIMSRLLAPTKDASDIMKAFGVDTYDAAWNSSTAMDRLLILAKHMGSTLKETGNKTKDAADNGYKLSDSQRAVAASYIGSRYQINRFLVLMRELNSNQGYYQKALDATSDRNKIFQQSTKELNAVLNSSPKRLEIIWQTIKNLMADAIQPLIPYLIALVTSLGDVVRGFSNLDPSLQKFILTGALVIALLGPVLKYFGSLITLMYFLAKPFKLVIRALAVTALGFRGLFFRMVEVEGEMVLFQRGWVAMGISMLKFPFRMIARGFGLIPTAFFYALSTSLKIAAWFGRIIPTMAAVGEGLWIVWSGIFGYLATIWKLGWTTLGLISGAGGAEQVGIMSKLREALALGAGLLWGTLRLLWVGGWGSLAVIEAAGELSIVAGIKTFGTIVIGMYVALGAALRDVWFTTWAAIHSITTIGGVVEGGLFARIGAVLSALWAAITASWEIITAGAWATIAIISAAGATGVGEVIVGGLAALPALIMGALSSPWVLAFAAVGALVFAFRGQLAKIWNNVVTYFADSNNKVVRVVLDAWYALPKGITNALVAVVNVVKQAALAVYGWFSYLNPFAHHSPSLVENVTNGIGIVMEQFGHLRGIGPLIKGVYADIKAFSSAASNFLQHVNALHFKKIRKEIAKFSPGALGKFDELVRKLKALKAELIKVKQQETAQQVVVNKWRDAVREANEELSKEKRKLSELKAEQTKWSSSLSKAQDMLSKLADAPLKGMRAMDDAIFQNEMSQKRLQLQMMKMEDAVGPLDKIKEKLDKINGSREELSGRRADLAAGGAGGNVLATYDRQIKALDKQGEHYTDTAAKLQAMQDQLDKLQHKGEELDLTKSLKFDPLTHQIENATTALKEMSFADIMSGIVRTNAEIKKYKNHLAIATAAVNAQNAVVQHQTQIRDKLKDKLEAEQKELDKLKHKYDQLRDAIAAVNNIMQQAEQSMGSHHKKKDPKGPKPSPAMDSFNAAAGGNFANVGGDGIPIRTDWTDQSKQIKQFTDQMNNQLSNAFKDLNPFDWIKGKFKSFVGWLGKGWHRVSDAANDFFSHAFSGVADRNSFDGVRKVWAGVQDFVRGAAKWAKKIWLFFWPSIKQIGQKAMKGINELWGEIKGPLGDLMKSLKQSMPIWRGLWKVAKPILLLVAAALAVIGKVALEVLGRVLPPLFKGVGAVIGGVIEIVSGLIRVITGFFQLFEKGNSLAGIKNIFGGLWQIVSGTFQAIYGVLRGAAGIIWGIVSGIWHGIVDSAKWLHDVLVGHSIIPDLVKAIIFNFKLLIVIGKWIWDHVIRPVVRAFKAIWPMVRDELSKWWGRITNTWNKLKELGSWIWDNALKPTFNRVKDLGSWTKDEFTKWWGRLTNAWNKLKELGSWVWDHVLKPVKDKFDDVKTKIGTIMDDIKTGIGDKVDLIKGKFDDFVGYIKDLPDRIGKFAGDIKSAGANLIGQFIKGFESAGDIVTKLAKSVWDFLKGAIDSALLKPLADALNFHIHIWKFDKDFKFGDKVPRLYQGGIVKGSPLGTPVVLGDRGYDEAVVPITGPYAFKGKSRYADSDLRSGSLPADGGATVINIYGDLSFPNIEKGSDAKDFITNLKNVS